MDIPEKIMKMVEELEIKEKKRKEAAVKRWVLEKRGDEELEHLKESRMEELGKESRMIVCWIQSFFTSPGGKRLLDMVGRIQIFNARFWKGYPLLENSVSESATIFVDKIGNVTYSERSKGNPSHDTSLGNIPLMPGQLIKKLHPDFLHQLSLHLESGAVWDYIEKVMSKKPF